MIYVKSLINDMYIKDYYINADYIDGVGYTDNIVDAYAMTEDDFRKFNSLIKSNEYELSIITKIETID